VGTFTKSAPPHLKWFKGNKSETFIGSLWFFNMPIEIILTTPQGDIYLYGASGKPLIQK
jgi:hypothetical protein